MIFRLPQVRIVSVARSGREVRVFTTLALLIAIPVSAIDYQKMADETAWKWSDEASTVGHSALLRQSTYDVRLETKAGKAGEVKITFGKDGKDVFTFAGHRRTVFRISGDTLYFASFHYSASGGSIVAVDLTSGKQLWKTQLKALGPIQHSAYLNMLNLEVSGGIVTVFGNESQGRYVEILDEKTGKTLGHKIVPKEKPVQKQQ